MGQCGCGEMNLTDAYPVAGTEAMLAVDEYWGCPYCNQPLGISLRLFDRKGWEEWGERVKTGEPMVPDEFGGQQGFGWWFPFIGERELVKAAREDEELREVDPSEYATLADLLDDYGLRLLRAAMKRRETR